MRTKIRVTSLLIVILSIAAAWQIGHAAYIHAKAQLAQVLLQRAWEKSLATQQNVKPWPWADTWPVARLTAPKHDVDLIVLAGDSGRTLAFGPGHQFGTVTPGVVGNSILSAHRDTHFAFLRSVSKGEVMRIQTRVDALLEYVVDDMIVLDVRKDKIMLNPDESRIMLLTCYPFDALDAGGPLRYAVILSPAFSSSTAKDSF